MTLPEIFSHGLTALCAAAPGLVIVLRTRAQTAQTHALAADKVADAQKSEADTMRMLVGEALDRARRSEDAVQRCRDEHASTKLEHEIAFAAAKAEHATASADCERRTRAVSDELAQLRCEIRSGSGVPA